MIVDDKLNKEIDKKCSRGMKPGFWAGLVSFLLAKISHILVTFAIGLWIGITSGGDLSGGWMLAIRVVDSWMVGLLYLVFVARFIYNKITAK